MAMNLKSEVARVTRSIPGASVAILIALAATHIAAWYGGPQLLYALCFGIAFHYLSDVPRNQAGIELCARGVLRLGVGFVGAQITASQIASIGWASALLIIVGIVTTFMCGLLMARLLRMTSAEGVLSGGAVAICGASAALAIAAVLPENDRDDRYTLMVVVCVTILSTVAMVVYPLIAAGFGLQPELAGLFLGGSIHDVAQVVGAGYTMSAQTGDVATIVKLFRVTMLTLVVLAVSSAFTSRRIEGVMTHPNGRLGLRRPALPWFLWLFVAMVALNSTGLFAPVVQSGLGTVSRWCLVIAIAALGLKTSFIELARAGWRPLLLVLIETLWLAGGLLTLVLLWR